MSRVYMFFANGFEEVEALTVVDLLRRAGIDIFMVSVTGEPEVTGSHKIRIRTDLLLSEIREDADMIVLPGGMPGTNHLKKCAALADMIRDYDRKGKYLAAICAAPTVYGEMGLLKNRRATCYPGMETGLLEAEHTLDSVAVSGNYITSRGLGTAIDFALKLIEILDSKEKADDIAESVVYKI